MVHDELVGLRGNETNLFSHMEIFTWFLREAQSPELVQDIKRGKSRILCSCQLLGLEKECSASVRKQHESKSCRRCVLLSICGRLPQPFLNTTEDFLPSFCPSPVGKEMSQTITPRKQPRWHCPTVNRLAAPTGQLMRARLRARAQRRDIRTHFQYYSSQNFRLTFNHWIIKPPLTSPG